MARLHQRRGDPTRSIRPARVDALVDRASSPSPPDRGAGRLQDALYQGTESGAARRRRGRGAREQVRPRDYDGLEAQLVSLDSCKFSDREPGGGPSAYARACRGRRCSTRTPALVARLEDFKCDADADLAARLRDELATAIDAYEAAKARVGALDFLDLLVRARDLVRDRADVRAAFQPRFTHLFVDEFQDTDPLQAEILLLLAADDPAERDWRAVRPVARQAVHRRRSEAVDLSLPARRRRHLRGGARAAAGARRRCVALRSSFRAVPDIQRAVNAAFAPRMTGDARAVQASYVPLAPVRPAQMGSRRSSRCRCRG